MAGTAGSHREAWVALAGKDLPLLGSMLFLGVGIGLTIQAVQGREAIVAAFGLASLVVLPRLIDFSITRRMAMKGLVPLADRATPGGARSLPLFPAWCWGLFAAGIAVAALGAWPR